jgi:RNA polymerase sigma-70 factor (ECF subfamily)
MPSLNTAPVSASLHLVCSVHREVTQPLFDEDYLCALRDRDPDAENFLISHFSRPVQLKLRARLRSPELIQDACQETFLRVLRHFSSGKTLDNPTSLPGFVHSVCHNVALELLRSHTRQAQVPENAPDVADTRPGPESKFVAGKRSELVGRVLNEMNEKDRQLLRRVFLDEEDKDQVCREFQVDRNYLRVLLHRARIRFRTVLTQGEPSSKLAAGGGKMRNVTVSCSTNQQEEG